jgi:HEAT repeats
MAESFPMAQESTTADNRSETISSPSELIKVIALLDRPETRLQALAKLIRFASPKLYQIGGITLISEPGIDALQRQAADAVRKQITIETIGEALDSTDPRLQFWGVFFWRGDSELQNNGSDEWMALLPKIEKVAVTGDETAREMAIERLQRFPEYHEFISGRVDVETSPPILMRLMYRTEKAEFSKQLNPLLLKLLKGVNCEVRHEALLFIGFNSNRAPMWQIDFDRSIFDATAELTSSESAKERAAAAYALTEIRKLDIRRSRESFLQMAEDDSEDVRWRIAWGLTDQLEREDVKTVIADLLKDPSPLVRYMTILAVGPEKHLKELKALAQGTDPKVSAWASEKLKQLSGARKAK